MYMTKILIAVDDSPAAQNAVEYAGRYFGKADGIELGLVHVLPNLPAIFWDEGHILSDGEKAERKKVVEKWLVDHRNKLEPLLKKAQAVLTAAGIPASKVQTKFISDSTDAADSVLEEAKVNGYKVVIVGRSHRSNHVLGTMAGKIAGRGAGLVVTIVD
jgi:nucleotide-binding universal stress UspA family protein